MPASGKIPFHLRAFLRCQAYDKKLLLPCLLRPSTLSVYENGNTMRRGNNHSKIRKSVTHLNP